MLLADLLDQGVPRFLRVGRVDPAPSTSVRCFRRGHLSILRTSCSSRASIQRSTVHSLIMPLDPPPSSGSRCSPRPSRCGLTSSTVGSDELDVQGLVGLEGHRLRALDLVSGAIQGPQAPCGIDTSLPRPGPSWTTRSSGRRGWGTARPGGARRQLAAPPPGHCQWPSRSVSSRSRRPRRQSVPRATHRVRDMCSDHTHLLQVVDEQPPGYCLEPPGRAYSALHTT
jgi:hypothetical protein